MPEEPQTAVKRVAQKQRKGRLSLFIGFNIKMYLTIILRGRAGYEMIYNQRGA